jgi:hypothetical protein
MVTYRAHGTLATSIEGRVLIAEHTGPFNVEYWQQAAKVIWPMIEELEESGPFAILVVFHGSALSSVEAMDVIVERNRGFSYTHPDCAGVAISADLDVEGRTIMAVQAERYFAALGAKRGTTGFFRQRDEAIEFLMQLVNARAAPGNGIHPSTPRRRGR